MWYLNRELMGIETEWGLTVGVGRGRAGESNREKSGATVAEQQQ